MQRRAVVRLAGTVAAGAAALAVSAPVAGAAVRAPADPGSGSRVYFVATTSASAAAFQLTQQPAASIITSQLVDDSFGYTAAAFDSSQGSEAQAASVFPGNLVVQGPSLLCNEGVLPFACPVNPPSYPLLADAQYPQHPHATAGPGTAPGTGKKSPFTVRAGQASADATANSAAGDTAGGTAAVLGGTPVAVSIGAQSSHSTVQVSGGGLTVHVVSHVSDISIGGLLHIGSVTGTVVQRLVPGRPPVDRPSVDVQDVTVAGQSATIGHRGLQIAGRRGPQLLRKLAAQHIKVSPVAASRSDSRHGARSDVTGLVVTTTLPVKHTPYIPNPVSSIPPFNQIPITGVDVNGTYLTTLQLGAAGSAAAVQRQPDLGLGSVAPVQPVRHLRAARPVAGGAGHAVAPAGGGSAPAPPAGGASAPASGSQPRVAATPASSHGFLDELDLSQLYLVLALGSAALFAGWRIRAALRDRQWLSGRRA